MKLGLIRHPSSPVQPIDAIHVDIERLEVAKLVLRYRLTGDVAAIAMPPLVTPERADDLWKTTCFEAFLRIPGDDSYVEFNLSPSTRWAGYYFESYRGNRHDFADSTMPRIDMSVSRESLELGVVLDLTGEDTRGSVTDVLFGLSAIIETRDGQKSYWALAHPPGAPDFHHGDCFAGILRAPDMA